MALSLRFCLSVTTLTFSDSWSKLNIICSMSFRFPKCSRLSLLNSFVSQSFVSRAYTIISARSWRSWTSDFDRAMTSTGMFSYSRLSTSFSAIVTLLFSLIIYSAKSFIRLFTSPILESVSKSILLMLLFSYFFMFAAYCSEKLALEWSELLATF